MNTVYDYYLIEREWLNAIMHDGDSAYCIVLVEF